MRRDGAMAAVQGSRRCSKIPVWLVGLVVWLLFSRGAQAANTAMRLTSGVAVDAAGNLYVADAATHQVWESTLAGKLVLFAGTGVQGFGGDGGPAVAAELNQPHGLAFGPDGTLYVADTGNQRIRAISAAGVISTFAGTGTPGFSGDGGSATAAALRQPRSVATDSTGAVLVSDTGNQRLRRISDGLITTIAGTGVQGFGGDGGPATAAALNEPLGATMAPDGRIFFADSHNQRVRVVNPLGVITTFAGSGVQGFAGDGGPALLASLFAPSALAWMPDGTLLIADEGNQRVRIVTSAGVMTTAAGSGVEGGSVDGATALAASMRGVRALGVSAFGLPVVVDALNGTARELTGNGTLFQPAGLADARSTGVSVQAATNLSYGAQEAVMVAVGGAAGVPQGRVQINEGDTVLGNAVLSEANATVSLPGLTAGEHALSVTYMGDGLNPASTAAAGRITVAPLPLTATASSSTVMYGLPLTSLSGALAGVLPADAGQVEVTFGTAAGAAPQVGTYPITAALSGPRAANYTVSMSPTSGMLQVVKAGVQAVLNNVSGAFVGLPVVLSASVKSQTSGQPSGTLQFLDGTAVIAEAPVQAGQASVSYIAPSAGVRSLSVQYLGDANFLPSTSTLTAVNIAALPDFTIASSGAAGASTASGGSATCNVLVSAQPGPFTGAIALSVGGLPQGATATFSPPQVIPGMASATVVMTVQTATASTSAQLRGRSGRLSVAFALLGCGWLLGWRRRPVLPWLCSATIFLAGCGARSVGQGIGGLTSQTYTLQVTGTATNLAGSVVTHATPVTLTVQQ